MARRLLLILALCLIHPGALRFADAQSKTTSTKKKAKKKKRARKKRAKKKRAKKKKAKKKKKLSKRKRARLLLKTGNAFFGEGDYLNAYRVYKEGYALLPSPVFLRSLAYSALQLYRHAEAQQYLAEYGRKYPRARDARRLRATSRSLETVVKTRITATSNPPGAKVYIDAEAAGSVGKTPFNGTIPPGDHILILKSPGYRPMIKKFGIKGGQAVNIPVDLEVTVKIDSDPRGASVHLGKKLSESVGTTPLEIGLKPGEYAVFLKQPGYLISSKKLLAGPKKVATWKGIMALGLRITSVPSGGEVTLDGRKVGTTPLKIAAREGSHTLKVVMPNYKDKVVSFKLSRGKSNDVNAKMEGGLFSMRTTPPGALVTVNGRSLGKTPLKNVTVPMGQHKVVVKHPGRRPWQSSLKFDDKKAVDAELSMGHKTWPLWLAGGVFAASLGAGIGTGAVALGRRDQYNADWCSDTGCSYGLHDTSTAMFITAGAAALFGTLYYILAVRPSEAVSHKKR